MHTMLHTINVQIASDRGARFLNQARNRRLGRKAGARATGFVAAALTTPSIATAATGTPPTHSAPFQLIRTIAVAPNPFAPASPDASSDCETASPRVA